MSDIEFCQRCHISPCACVIYSADVDPETTRMLSKAYVFGSLVEALEDIAKLPLSGGRDARRIAEAALDQVRNFVGKERP